MFAAEIRRAVEAAPRDRLPEVATAIWKAYGAGALTDEQAEQLDALMQARQVPAVAHGENIKCLPRPLGAPRKPAGSRPVSTSSLERCRRWTASGRLPPAIAARFTLAEQAVLALVAAESVRRGDCRLAIGHVAAVAGVSRSTVKNAIREARRLGLVTVEERKVTGFRNLSNVVRIVSPEWQAWNRLAPGSCPRGGGVKFVTRTPTDSSRLVNSGPSEPSKKLPTSSGRHQPRSAIRNSRRR